MNARPDTKHLFVSTHLAKAQQMELREAARPGGGYRWTFLILIVLIAVALWALSRL
jgi:hypothetical protein